MGMKYIQKTETHQGRLNRGLDYIKQLKQKKGPIYEQYLIQSYRSIERHKQQVLSELIRLEVPSERYLGRSVGEQSNNNNNA